MRVGRHPRGHPTMMSIIITLQSGRGLTRFFSPIPRPRPKGGTGDFGIGKSIRATRTTCQESPLGPGSSRQSRHGQRQSRHGQQPLDHGQIHPSRQGRSPSASCPAPPRAQELLRPPQSLPPAALGGWCGAAGRCLQPVRNGRRRHVGGGRRVTPAGTGRRGRSSRPRWPRAAT